jgi:acetoin utilization deacetylase AcuC-like enzyme
MQSLVVISNKEAGLLHPAQNDVNDHVAYEYPERLERIERAFLDLQLPKFEAPSLVDESLLLKVYTSQQLANLKSKLPSPGDMPLIIGHEMEVNEHSWAAATSGVAAGKQAVDLIVNNQVRHVICSVRPPTHHATQEQQMGYCMMPAAGITAIYAQDLGKRVAIFDYDAHCGNGTAESVLSQPNILFTEIRGRGLNEYPSSSAIDYPVSGKNAVHEDLTFGKSNDRLYKNTFEEKILPKIVNFKPDMIIISAGTDILKHDPLGDLGASIDTISFMTSQLGTIAPTITFTEGGYHEKNLYDGFKSHSEGLLGIAQKKKFFGLF